MNAWRLPESQSDRSQATAEAAAGPVRSRGLARRALPWAARGLGLLVLVALGFLGVDYGAGLRLILDARPQFLIPAFAVFCGSVAGRMTAWVLVASSLKLGYTRVWSYARVFLIGWFSGLALPRGAAPLARLAVVAADKRSVGRGTVAIVADRLIDVGVILALLTVSGVYLATVSVQVLRGLLLGGAVVLVAILILVLAMRLMRRLRRRLPSYRLLRSFIAEASDALGELRRMPISRVGSVVVVALLASLLNMTALFLSSRALEIDISYMALLGAWSAVRIVNLLPISINGLGPREGILTAAVAGAGLNSEGGVALGLLWFLMQVVTRLVAGGAWFVGAGEPKPDLSESEQRRGVAAG